MVKVRSENSLGKFHFPLYPFSKALKLAWTLSIETAFRHCFYSIKEQETNMKSAVLLNKEGEHPNGIWTLSFFLSLFRTIAWFWFPALQEKGSEWVAACRHKPTKPGKCYQKRINILLKNASAALYLNFTITGSRSGFLGRAKLAAARIDREPNSISVVSFCPISHHIFGVDDSWSSPLFFILGMRWRERQAS